MGPLYHDKYNPWLPRNALLPHSHYVSDYYGDQWLEPMAPHVSWTPPMADLMSDVWPRMWSSTPYRTYYSSQHSVHINGHQLSRYMSADDRIHCRRYPWVDTSEPKSQLMSLLEKYECLATDCLDARKRHLKLMAEFVSGECERFGGHPSMAHSLKTFDSQLSNALNATEDTKQGFIRDILDMKSKMADKWDIKSDLPAIDMNSVSVLAELLTICKDSVHKMPELKTHPLVGKQSGDKYEDNTNDNQLDTNNNDFESKPIAEELSNFGVISHTIVNELVPRMSSKTDNAIDGYTCFLGSQLSDGLNKSFDSLDNNEDNKTIRSLMTEGEESFDSMESLITDSDTSPSKLKTKRRELLQGLRQSDANDSGIDSPVTARDQLSASRRIILDRLRHKYPYLSEQLLMDSIVETKQLLISSGQNGFAGLKMGDMITKIADHIESEVVDREESRVKGKVVAIGVECDLCSYGIHGTSAKQTLSCGHSFHVKCIGRWVHKSEGRVQCPQCW